MFAIVALAAACSSTPTPLASDVPLATPAATPPLHTGATPPTLTPGATARVASALHVATLAVHLPGPVSRAVAFADGNALLLAGGLTPSGTTATVLRIDVAGGEGAVAGAPAQARP